MKIKSFILLMLLIATLQSCSSPLEKNYNSETEKQDLILIRNEIGDQDFEVLLGHLSKIREKEKASLSLKSYATILQDAKLYKAEEDIRLKKEYDAVKKEEQLAKEEQQKAEQEQEEAEKKSKIKMLCANKWGVYYNKPDFVDVNPEVAKNNKELAKIAFNTDADKNWIIFNEDGSCNVLDEENTSRGRSLDKPLQRRWKLEGNKIIFEYGIRKDSKYTTYTIIQLTPDEFEVLEEDNQHNLTFKSHIKMKKIMSIVK